eukprot:c8003_g1_i1 orf=406-810(-)
MGIIRTQSVLLLVLLLISSSAGSVVTLCSGNFSMTCSSVQLVGTSSLQALCGDGLGGFATSSLDLDGHITNSDGSLECTSGDGNFSASCQSMSFASIDALYADCFDAYGNLYQTSVNLDECVQNTNGELAWACL